MSTGIIYLAKNTINGKCYCGQTTKTLEQRKKEHLKNTIKLNYKFGKALRKYSESTWEWSILTKCPIEKLDEYERFFIKDLDTYRSGYNSHIGGGWEGEANPANLNPIKLNNKIYELWHPEHGEIRETATELNKRHKGFSKYIKWLVRGERQHINGYVLLKNKDSYQKLIRIYDFYHPEVGVVTCTTKELFNTYQYLFKTKRNHLYKLCSKRVLSYFGWVLAENRNKYEDIINLSSDITLTHPEHGTLTLKRSEFREKFGLASSGMTGLKCKKIKNHKGWGIPN